ncbi:ARL14 effector protein [Araneus ventricosus]|uniref:ARL14 effector protein n=1 Tax=Araneus ventricosus TaxID=182803 RepID=A0A4Y2A5B6_ARAVE|nr:ARL14 effector protein [Araneus ventricosus]
MEKCSVGKFTHSDCHLLNYVNRKAIQAIEKLSETDLNLLKLRTDSNYELKTICLHHQSVFLKNYEFLQKVCCDPFKKHKTTIKKMLRVVTVEQSRIILYKGFKVKPGQKLCASCRNKLLKIKQIDESNVQNSLNTEDEDHDVEFTPAELLQKRNVIAELNSSFHEIGCSPMKLHALGEHSRSFYGKEKLQRVHETVKEKIQNVLEVDLPEEKNDVEKSVIKKSEDLDKLVDIIKNELSGTSRRKQIQMLTIPASLMWSRRKIKETFNVSDYSVRKAQKLFKDQGFLAEPARRNGKQLSPDIIELVKKFYQLSLEFCRG